MKRNLANGIGALLGPTFAGYVFYEAKLLLGLFRFILSPIKTYKAVMASYFATEMLKGIFMGIGLLMILETGLMHFMVGLKATGITAVILHVIIILSEFYLCEIILGNLYYLQYSKVTIDENIGIKLGLLWDFSAPLTAIERLEPISRVKGEKTPKIALLQDQLFRVSFKAPVSAVKFFRPISLHQADIFLKEPDLQLLRNGLDRQAATSVLGVFHK